MKGKNVLMCILVLIGIWAVIKFTPKSMTVPNISEDAIESVVEGIREDYEETKASGKWSLYNEVFRSGETE